MCLFSRQALRSTSLILCANAFLLGCAVTDEGATDFRFVGASQGSGEPGGGGTGAETTLWRKTFLPAEASGAITPNRPISVVLKHAFIADFVELFGNPLAEGAGPNGEIAIVANVFEDDGTKTVNYGSDGLENARVVYFSDDVWKGQPLNFHDVPIYGPIKYNGGPLVLDIHIVELDQPGPQLRQLMANLAKIGSVAYPPASPIAGPLAQLAGTLITDDQDDRAYRHTLSQRPVGGVDDVPHSVLDAGHLVFIRSQERRTDIDWSRIGFNPNLAILVHAKPDDPEFSRACLASANLPPGCAYRDSTYLVVEVNTATSSLRQDRQQILFSALREDVAAGSAPIFRDALPEDALTQIQERIAETTNADIANSALNVLERDGAEPSARAASAELFANIWFNQNAAISDADQASLMTRIGAKLAGCGVTSVALGQKMARVRSRDQAARDELMQDVSC